MWKKLVSLITIILTYKRFLKTDVALQSVTDVPVDSVKVCALGEDLRNEGIESVPPNSSVVQVQTVAKALGPKDIERLSRAYPQHAQIF